VRVRHEALAINRSAKTVRVRDLDAGREYALPYDKLILAPGATPFVPPVDGVDAQGVFTLRNLADTDAIRAAAVAGQPAGAVIVGGGFIGLEMAEQLHNLGIETQVVELQPHVLPMFDPEMVRPLEDTLATHGVGLHTGDGLATIATEDGRAAGVELASGKLLRAELVVLGIGVRPSTALADAAGIELGASGAIRTNRSMQTSDPDIYAAGDAVEYARGPDGSPGRVALAGPANRAGRIAGEHALRGSSAEMPDVFGTAIVRVFEHAAGLTGMTLAMAEQRGFAAAAVTVIANHHAGYFPGAKPLTLKLVYETAGGRVLGLQAVGEAGVDKRLDVAATLMALGGSVRDLAGVDLAYAPPFGAAKDPIHMAAFAACNDLDGWVDFLPADADVSGYQVVDVREPHEPAALPLSGVAESHLIPLGELRERLGELDATRPTVTMCTTGMRAYVAARILCQSGFAEV
jgi:NADPH-dependent 2,4-dienoyl-CoA reductase/sulfur reductase-like enzyme